MKTLLASVALALALPYAASAGQFSTTEQARLYFSAEQQKVSALSLPERLANESSELLATANACIEKKDLPCTNRVYDRWQELKDKTIAGLATELATVRKSTPLEVLPQNEARELLLKNLVAFASHSLNFSSAVDRQTAYVASFSNSMVLCGSAPKPSQCYTDLNMVVMAVFERMKR